MTRFALILSTLLVAASTTFAQDTKETNEVARVQSGLVTKSPTWVAQEVSFYVKLMSSTFFSGSPRFDIPEIPGVILMKVEGRPVLGTDTIDGDSWTTQRHEFRAYAHRVGTITIPPFPVRFSVAPGFGSPPQEQRIMTEQMTFEAKMPPGAESVAMLVSTSRLEVTDTWNPKPDKEGTIALQVGDALQRQITLQAVDVPGMALPPIQLPTPDGMSAYPKSPDVRDQADRGDLVGSRTESITYICERAGPISIPAQFITWWDIQANELHQVTLDAISVEVEAAEVDSANAPQAANTSQSPSSDGKSLLMLLIAAAMATAAWWRWGRSLANWFEDFRERNAQSEKALFAKVSVACHSGNPTDSYNAIVHWLDAISDSSNTVTLESLQTPPGNESVNREWDQLQRAVVRSEKDWHGEKLLSELIEFKKQFTQSQLDNARHSKVLPELNPRA